ncbi:hypothetical protein D3C73_668160 [compost metagenome]
MERHAFAGVLVINLETRAGHQNPLVVEVDGILQEGRIAAQFIGLRAVGRTDGGTRHFPTIDRIDVTERGQAFLADQVFAVDLAVLVIDAEQQVVLHTEHIHIAFEAGGGESVGADRVLRAVHAAGQGALFCVDGGHSHLAGVVGFAVPAVAEMGFPVVVEFVIGLEVIEVRTPFHVVERLIETLVARDIQRVVGPWVDQRTAVERREEFAVLIGEQQLGAFTVPGQRRRNQAFAMHAEVAPVIFVFVVQHHAVGQPGIAEGAGAVESAAAAVLAVVIARTARSQRVVLLKFGLLADHVDHAARILDAVEQRGRALEHFDPVHAGVEATPLHDRHAVAHDRAVAVVTKTAGHHRVLGAGQRVALSDAADVGQCIVEIARGLVTNDLGRDHIDGLGNFLKRSRRTHHRAGGWRLVARG